MVMTAVSQDSIAVSAVSAIAAPVKTEARTSSPSHQSVAREDAQRAFKADVIVQLKSNLAQLEDLHARMHFLMGEIGYLLKIN